MNAAQFAPASVLASSATFTTAIRVAEPLLKLIPEIAPYVGPLVQALNAMFDAHQSVKNDVEYLMELLYKLGNLLRVIQGKPRKSWELTYELQSLAERMQRITKELEDYLRSSRLARFLPAVTLRPIMKQHKEMLKLSFDVLRAMVLAEVLLTVDELKGIMDQNFPQAAQPGSRPPPNPQNLSNAVWTQYFHRDFSSFNAAMHDGLFPHSGQAAAPTGRTGHHRTLTWREWSGNINVASLRLPNDLLYALFKMFDQDGNECLDEKEVASLSMSVLHISNTFYDIARYEQNNQGGQDLVPIYHILFLLSARGYEYTPADVEAGARSASSHFIWEGGLPVAAMYEGYLALYLYIITRGPNRRALQENMRRLDGILSQHMPQTHAPQQPAHQHPHGYHWRS